MSEILDVETAAISAPMAKKQKAVSIDAQLNRINRAYAITPYGDSVAILKTDEEKPRYLKKEAFLLLMENQLMHIGSQQAPIKLGQSWLSWNKRRQYDDVVFYPGDCSDRNVYNLWKGFAFEPNAEGDCSLFLDHLRVNICREDDAIYNWMLDWMADAIQKPHRKNWTAVLLEGREEGTGKGFFANTFGKLFGAHYAALNKPNQLIGQFNSHLEDKQIIFLDEGSLTEKAAYDFAKSLITEPTLQIEPKGRSMREVSSYHRIIMASNDEHILRASTHDRRWMVLRVGALCKNNLDYFNAIDLQMRTEDGYAALMHLLTNRKYSENTVKTIIKTEAHAEQKEQNLPAHIDWWKNCLANRMIGASEWCLSISVRDFYGAYITWCDQMKINRRESSFWLSRRLNTGAKLELKRKGQTGTLVYDLPTVEEARGWLEEALGYPVQWDD